MRTTFRTTLLVVALVALLVPGVAAADPPPRWEIDEAQVAGLVAGLEAAGSTVYSGELDGAAWVAEVPPNWDGETLFVWAHGYRGEFATDPLLTVSPPNNRAALLEEGYAWAASSYRRNSYDPGIGVLDTKNLTDHVTELLGTVEHTYLAGVSMGGHVTAAAIERFPDRWDGALPACGVLGDVELFDYFLDYNVGAAAFAGIPADELDFPSDTWVAGDVVDIKDELSTGAFGFLPWAAGGSALVGGANNLSPAGQQFKDFVEVGSGGERGFVYDVAWDYWHVGVSPDFFFDLGEGDGTIANRNGRVSQNTDTSYATEYGPAFDIDDEVLRLDAANRVRKAQGQKPAPIIAGTPSVPVLTMHTIGDLFVPIEMEQLYAQEVAANGRSDLLVQRAIRDVGHCTFSPGEWAQATTDLVAWVEEGVVPAGEDLVADISDPLLGCAFTIDAGAPPTAVRGLSAFCP